MAGAYCRYCGNRCFVYRQIWVGGQLMWAGHMASCSEGMEHDRSSLGVDANGAHNPMSKEVIAELIEDKRAELEADSESAAAIAALRGERETDG